MNEDLKSLLDGIIDLAEFSKEDTLRIAKIFADSAGSPLAIAWREIFEQTIKGYYFTQAHLSDKDLSNVVIVAKFSGFIRCIENLIRLPKEFADAVIEIEKVEEEKEKDV